MITSDTIIVQRQVISTTYASFPTSGSTVGDLAWATDRQCLYRWSGSAWESIGISSRHGNYADIGTASDYPESSLYQADDQGLLYMVVTAAWVQIVFMPSLPLWLVGSAIAMAADTERITNSTSLVKVKEIQIASGGTIRTSFDLKTDYATHAASGRIYKNGVAFGTMRSTGSLSYVTYTEDLAFATGDLVQLYYAIENAVHNAYTRNFRLLADRLHLHQVNTD